MTEVLIALLGIMGTLSAGVLTSTLQHRSARETQAWQNRQRLWDKRAEVVSKYASQMTEFRRAEVQCWHQVADARKEGRSIDVDHAPSGDDLRTARVAAWSAFYELRLLWDDEDLIG